MASDDVLTKAEEDALCENWDGVMITYEECDFPGVSTPYMRSIPGWKCKGCGAQLGTSGLPPRRCFECGRGPWR